MNALLPLIYLKIGGSIITDKSSPYTLRPKQLEEVISWVKELSKQAHVILFHGAGSYGHTAVQEARERLYDPPTSCAYIHHAAMELHQIVISECTKQHLPVYGVPALLFALQRTSTADHLQPQRKIDRKSLYDHDTHIGSLTSSLVASGLTPVLFGDAIPESGGYRIISTENLMKMIALSPNSTLPSRIIQLTDTPGVLDPNGNTIPVITRSTIRTITFFSPKKYDVTGGMQHKVESSLELADHGIPTWIIQGSSPAALASALTGENTGTLIQPSRDRAENRT